jgi:hypothetical protein
MTVEPYDQLVLDAVRYRRYVGADLDGLRAWLRHRATEHDGDDDRAALERLEKQGSVVKVGERWFLSPRLEAQASGPAFPPTWQSEDSWILLALLHNDRLGGASTLGSLLRRADLLNHAMPTLGQLHGALNRLASAGLIRALSGTYEVTDRARGLFAKAERACSHESVLPWVCLGHLLQCPCCGAKLESVGWRINLTPAEWDAAYAHAHAQFQAALNPSIQLAPSGRRRTLPVRRPRSRRQRAPFRAVKLSPFARYGMIWSLSAMALVMLAVIVKPQVPTWLFVAIALSYLATGFGLLASGPVRYIVRRFRKKDARPVPLQGSLWDQELDG